MEMMKSKRESVEKLKNVFEGIRFLSYHIPEEISADLAEREDINDLGQRMWEQYRKNRENVRHATFDLSGSWIDIFTSVPEVQGNMAYWAESCSVFHCGSHFFTSRERFDSYLILYTYAGEGCLEYEGKTYSLRRGDGFFIDCRKFHYYATKGELWQHSVLHLQGKQMEELYRVFENRWGNMFSMDINDHYQKNLEHLLMIYEKPSPVREWLAADCIGHLLTELLERPFGRKKEKETKEMVITEVVSFMEQNFTAPFTLEELAERSGISRYYFAHEFTRYMGVPPMAYLMKLRIGHAKILLESTELPVSQIAEAVGIGDINHFYRQFRKYEGMTPGNFRKLSH